MSKFSFRHLAAVAALAAATGLGTIAAHAQDALRIGVLLPLTGVNSTDGNRVLQSHQLAAKHINEAGGIAALNGARIELVIADTQSRPEVSRSEAERLISRENVQALTGAWTTGATLPALQLAERNRIPFIIPNAFTDPITEQGMQYVFRITSKSSFLTRDMMAFTEYLKDKGAKVSKVGIIYADDAYGQSVRDVANAGFKERGFEVVAEPSFKGGTADLNTQVAQLKAAGAELIVFGCFAPDTALIMKTMAAQSYKPHMIGLSAGILHPLIADLGEMSDGIFGVTDWMSDINNEASTNFVAAYEKEYGERPINTLAMGYMTVYVAAAAAEAAGSLDPVKLREALTQLHLTEGPAALLPGGIKFDETGQNAITNVGAQKIGGQFLTVWPEGAGQGQVQLPQ